MTTTPIALRIQQSNLALPILVGGAVAGTFDLIAAFISFGPGSPRAIAGGLLAVQLFKVERVLTSSASFCTTSLPSAPPPSTASPAAGLTFCITISSSAACSSESPSFS